MYSLCRLIFFILYFSTFIEADKGELFSAFFYGLRFDGLVVAWSNLLFIFLSFIPAKKNIQVVLDSLIKWLYLLSNSIFIFFNCVDFAYYRYINKRSGVDIFNQAFGGQTDVILQLPDYLRDFWFAILAFTSLVFLLFYGWKISNRLQPSNTPSQQQLNLIHRIVGTTGICSLTLIGLRGGIQPIPLQLVDASRYIAPQYVSLVLNTPFTIIRSMESSRLPELQLEKNEEAFRYFQPVQQFNRKDFKNKNRSEEHTSELQSH